MNPEDVIAELKRIQEELGKGSDALYAAEVKLAEAEDRLDRAEAEAFLSATGTAGERTAESRLVSADYRFARDLARAEVNRVKTKIRNLESASVAVSVMAKQIELTWRHA